MAITKASLSGKFQTKLQALFGAPTDSQPFIDMCDALAESIVEEIQENLEATNLNVPAAGIFDSTSGACTGASTTGTIAAGDFQ